MGGIAVRVITALAVVGVLAGCSGPGWDPSVAPVGGPQRGPGQLTALMVTPAHDAQVVLGDDGMEHVEYELIVLNVFVEPVTLTSLSVRDPRGAELLRLEGDALEAASQTLLSKVPGRVVPASASVGIDVDVAVAPGTAPRVVTNRIEYELEPDSTAPALVVDPSIDGPEVRVDRRPTIELAPPLRGDGWLATSACCTPNVHRSLRVAVDGQRIDTPETFAVDWALIEDGRVAEGDGTRNEQYFNFGKDVHAVADGTVVSVVDGLPNSDPTEAMVPTHISQYGGNQVMLRLRPGVFAWYAHLQPGSIPVEVGERVRTGDVLGRIGNSGPSAGPHLHLGILDRPDPTSARSLPFVLDEYTRVGYVDFERSTDDQLVITGESKRIEGAHPLHGSIQNFR